MKIGDKYKLELEQIRNEIITSDFRGKQVDVLYKQKGKEIYFLIEHQLTQDKDMSYRVLEYQTQIISERFRKNNFKEDLKARVITIVLYTGPGKWKAARRVDEILEKFGHRVYPKEDYNGIGEYNLLELLKLTKDELIKEDTLLSKAMLLEKARKEEELIETLEKIIPRVKKEEIGDMISIIRYILIKDLGMQNAKKYIKMLEGRIDMGTFVNVLRRNREKELEKIRIEGEKQGERRGRQEGEKSGNKKGKIEKGIEIAKNMLKEKMDINIIEKITGLKRNQFM